MQKFRKFLAASTIIATFFGFVANINVANAAAADGSLIKMNGISSVYYLSGGKRYVFPNEATYFSWYSDWNGVQTISQDELQSYPLGGNVVVRPGTKLVKITTNPTVYAVEPNGTLRSIVSEANAIALYGANWAQMVIDVADSFFTNYTVGAPLTAGMYPVGTILNPQGTQDLYYFDGTNYRKFSNESALLANGFSFNYVVTTTKTFTAGGNPISGAEAGLMMVAQGAGTGQAGTPVYTGGSGLTVALAANTPVASNVAKGATQVPFMAFNVTASNDGDITLKNVVLTRGGIGSASDFTNVYLYDGTTRLTTGRSVNTSTNKANFTGVNLVIPKGTTKTITVKADMNATTANNNFFSIAAASDIDAGGATVAGTFPISGNTLVGVNQAVGSITIDKTGSPSNPKAGEQGVKIGEFKLTAGSTEDVMLHSVVLYNSGSLASDKISNFVLKQAGVTLATVATENNSLINFQLDTPLLMEKGNSRSFEVYADISGTARANDTISLYMDNDADLYAVGNTYGFGVTVTRNFNSTTPYTTTVQAGQLTIAYQGPSVQDYSTQQQDVELFRFNITSQSNVEIRKTYLTLLDSVALGAGTSPYVPHFTDVKFTDITNGKNNVIVGPKDVTVTGTSETLTYTDTWNMAAGETKTVKVTADIANFTPGGTETIKATLGNFTSGADVKNLDTNTFLVTADMVPSGSIAGNTMNIKAATVSLTKAGTPAAQSYINGSQAVPTLGVNVTAGQGKDIKITSLSLTAVGANDCSTVSNCVLSVKLYDGDTQVGDTKSLDSNSKAVFSNLQVMVPKGTTKTLIAKVDFNSLSTPITGSTSIHLNVAATGDISAQDVDGNTVTNSSTITGNNITILGAGTLTASAGSTVTGETDSRLVAAGSSDVILGRIRFNATNEDLQLNKIRIRVQKNGSAAADTDVTGLALFDGATMLAPYSSPSANGSYAIADFTLDPNATNKFIVPKDGYKELTIKGNLNTITGGLTSGDKLVVSVDGTNNVQFRGIGGSNTTISSLTGGDVTASNTLVAYKSIPTVAVAALPTTVLVGGEQTLSKFTITADAKGVIDWTQIIFPVSGSAFTTSGAVSAARLVDESGTTLPNVTCTPASGLTTPAASISGNITCVSTVDQTIGGGSSRTYQLKGTIAGATTGSTLGTTIGTSDAYLTSTTNALANAKYFVWSDESGTSHAIGSSTDYTGGYLVKTLPSDSQTLAK